MPQAAETKTRRELIREAQAEGLTIRQTARKLGIHPRTVSGHWSKSSPSPDKTTRTETADGLLIESLTRTPIRTVEEAIAYHKIDLKVWYVDRFETTDWEMGYTTGPQPTKEARTQPLTRVKLSLKRVAPRAVLDGLRLLKDELSAIGARRPPAPVVRPRATSGSLLEIDLFDVHFGKLAWAPESGQDYDLGIAEARLERAVDDLLLKSRGWDVSQVLLPIGNDFFHIDNRRNTTLGGTQMDVDSRYAKIWKVAKRAAIRAVDRLAWRAPIHILWVPGNHDFHPSFHLVDVLSAYYRSSKAVTVDESPSVRKLYHWGASLIGYQHGETVKGSGIRDLPDVLTAEALRAGIDLREIVTREFHLGHRHHEQTWSQRDLQEIRGCKVRWLSSLSADDFWHHEHLFVGSTQAATAHIYDRDDGFQAQLLASVEPRTRPS